MQKWYLYLQKRCWSLIVTFVRSATRGSKGIKTYRCIAGGTRFRGSY
uniref:Uncharacterized protein MANES_06G001400 n=1 Tax=Rhizophora mucronata TaxID=61149 RepID=A0A2P2PX80_RHIMU